MNQKKYLISIDIGTQGTKAALFDLDMQMLYTAFEKSNLISPETGIIWQEADDLYMSCARTVKELMEKSKVAPESVVAIGIDGQMAGIMGIDSEGEASTYYDSWLDMRSGKYLDVLMKAGNDKVVSRSGGQICCNHASKIIWWKNEHPDIYEKTAKFVLPHGYVVGKITGTKAEQAYYDYTCLHFNNFSDNKNKGWSKEILDACGIDEDKMPRVVSPFEVIGKTTQAFADISGLVSGIPVTAGAGDTAASTFGSGMFEEELVQDIAGTASIMSCVVNGYVPDVEYKTLSLMRSPIDGLWLPLAYINGGGLCIRWFRDNFTGDPSATYEQLNKEAEGIAEGSEGVIFCPHFSGRVLPTDDTLKGGFLNLDFKHTRGHLYRSIMEGIAYEYQYYLSIIRKSYPKCHFNDMIVIGGGANSPIFNKIKADVLGVKVKTFECGDTALIGSAVIAAIGAGVFTDYKEPIRKAMKQKAEFMPNKEVTVRYEEMGERYRQMIESTSKLYKNYK